MSSLAVVAAPAWAASSLVASGQAVYQQSPGLAPMSLKQAAAPASPIVGNACNSCHFSGAAPGSDGQGSNHPLAANNTSRMQAAFGTGGLMLAQIGAAAVPSPTNAQLDAYFKLTLWIGQFKAALFRTAAAGSCTDPNLTINATAGVAVTKDVYPCLETDGSSGVAQDSGGFTNNNATSGLTVTSVQNATSPVGGVSTLSYDLGFQSTAGFTPNSGSFQISIINPTGTTNKVINWTVYGVTSAATAAGTTGTAYTVGSPLYQAQSNDLNGTFAIAGSSPTSLAALGGGMVINASTGKITGTLTAAPGTYTVRVQVTTNATTVGAGNTGVVTKDVTLTVQGVTSAATATFAQNSAIANQYQITSFPAATASGYTVSTSTPAGLTLGVNAASGQLTGTPTTSGTFTVTVGATTSAPAASVTKDVTVTVTSAGVPVISSNIPASPTVAGTIGSAIDGQAWTVSLSNPSLTGMVFGATGLPTNVSVNGAGQFIGTPTLSGDFPISITGSNSSGAGTPVARTIRINPIAAPVISGPANANVPANQFGTAYTIAATNPPILSYSVLAGALPTGLTLNANGTVAGTPTVSGGPTNVTFRATNVVGNSNDLVVAFTISPSSQPVVTAPFVAAPTLTGTVGSAIAPTIQIAATNPPITAFGATGLPSGLTVSGSGLISGVPAQSGDFDVVATADNVQGQGSSAPAVKIRIAPNAVPLINSAFSASSNVNAPFNYAISATNPVFSGFAVASGALPAGLGLVVAPTGVAGSSTAAITGTPTVSGPFNVTLTATNSFGTSAPFALAITIVPTSVPVVTATIPPIAGTNGSAITPIQIQATNPVITAYSATGLPTGLSVNGQGQIVGTPSVSGTFSVTLQASNAAGQGSSAPVSLVINPNAVPAINSAATVSGTVNTAITNYQITATNNPLTAFAVKAPSVLPSGLSLNTSSGVISGTPSVSGNSSAVITASNLFGTSADFALNFAIAPDTVPAITSPTFASFPAGTQIAPIQVVTTNLPIISFGATGLPPGLTINTGTGQITGTPTTPGPFSATITATNAIGPGNRVVPFTVGVPAPLACVMTVPLNTPTALNLAACLFSGFNPTGVTVLSTPSHGSAVASGTSVTYTPVRNYFGSDSFTFVGTGSGGTSPQGTVTVTVTGRPDPTQDPTVVAIVAAQVETAQRFSRAQISNYQRRMEALHRPPGGLTTGATSLLGQSPSVATFAGNAAFGASALSAATATPGALNGVAPINAGGAQLAGAVREGPFAAGGSMLAPVQSAAAIGAALALPRTIGSDILGTPNFAGPGLAIGGAREVRESEALGLLAGGTGLKSLPFADSVISLIKSRSVDLAAVGSAAGLNTSPDKSGATNYWIEGVASFGTRDASTGVVSSEFSSSGITIGTDRRINDQLAWGMGLGYARDKSTIGTDGSVNRAKGYSLAVYGSYQLSDKAFIDGLLGVGSLDFNTRRFVAPANDFALGQRSGTQIFGALTGGYEFRDQNTLISPYARLDFATERLGTSTETGAGLFALTYFGQTTTSIQGALGVRGETAHAASFGYVIPKLRAELRHEFKGTGQAFVGYADQPGGPRFGISSTGSARDSLVLGLGSDFLLRDGLTLSMEYQLSHSFSNSSSYALRFRLSKDFDVKGMPKLKLAELDRDEDELQWQFDAGYTVDDNVTRAKSGPDRLRDDLYSFNLGRTFERRLTDQSRLLYTGTIGGQRFHRFNGLSNVQVGVEAEYQYRESAEFSEPTWGVFGKLNAEQFESRLRDGYRLSVGLSVRLPLTDRIGAFAAVAHNVRNARSEVFSTRDTAVRGNIDYALSSRETIYFGSELRVGDIVSTGRPSLENATIAKVFAQDDAYAGGQLFSYKVDGRTWLLTVGYNLSFGTRDSVDFSWRNVRATPGLRPSFVTGPRSYRANQLSAVYLLRF